MCSPIKGYPMRVRSRLVGLAWLFLFGAALGCTSVKSGDLVGNWIMTDASRQVLPSDLRSLAPRLTLAADSTFIAGDLPKSRSIDAVVARSGHGMWRVRAQQGRDLIQLTFEGGFGDELDISNSRGSQTTLYYFIGDPDSGQRIEFIKQ